jgi:hypothetical protein
MEYAYQRGEDGSFLVIKEAQRKTEDFDAKMLARVSLNKFLKRSVIAYDEGFQIRYEISGMQSAEKFYEERAIGRRELFQILWEIERAKKECQRFLLSEKHFFFRPAFAYLNFKNDGFRFVYLPEEETEFSEEMMEMAEFVLEKLDHQDEAAVEIAYELYERAGEENFLLRQFLEEAEKKENSKGKEEEDAEIERLEWEKRDREKEEREEDLPELQRMQFPDLEEYEEEEEKEGFLSVLLKGFSRDKKKEKRKTEEKESNGLEELTEDFTAVDTVWLGQIPELAEEKKKEETIGELLPLGENCERILLNKDFILIGKAEGYADGVIRDETVSRIHAEILREKEDYYIEDCNSKNGTRLDGELLQPNERRKLEKGMKIGFGQSLFLFR